MKKISYLLAVTGLLILLCLPGCTSNNEQKPMTVNASISMSDKSDTPTVIDTTNTILLEFSEILDMDTVENGVKLYKVKSTGDFIEIPCKIIIDKSIPRYLIINTNSGTNLPEGEEYKLTVSSSIKSNIGLSLTQDYEGYFSTGYSFNLKSNGMAELNNTRTLIICISDIHLGDKRSIDNGYGWFYKNQDALVKFLTVVRQAPHVKELVIAGDMFDEWVAPMDATTFDGKNQSEFVDLIAAANLEVLAAFNNIINDGQVKVTYVPGNHDMLVTSADIQRILPGINEARDTQGLGAYTPDGRSEIIIEHGHRYDFYNAPDPISNRTVTNTTSILPPGFFVTKIATTSDLEKNLPTGEVPQDSYDSLDQSQQHYFYYWGAWRIVMAKKPVKDSWDDKIIKTGIDGYTDSYAINDLIPHHTGNNGPLDVNLYKGIQDTWDDRQTANNVPVHIWTTTAITAGAIDLVLDAQAVSQYFLNPDSNKRIVVFGHTHKALIYPFANLKLQKTVYANSGTWVDKGDPTMTFVVIIPQKSSESTTEYITTYQYSQSGTITKLDSSVITNMK